MPIRKPAPVLCSVLEDDSNFRNKIWGMPLTWNLINELEYHRTKYLNWDDLALFVKRKRKVGGSQPSREEKLLKWKE